MSHLHAQHHYHLPRMREMGRVYWIHSFGALATSLVEIFVPIYLLISGLSLTSVLLFVIAQYGLSALLQYPFGKLFRRISPHHLLAYSTLFVSVYFLMLATLELSFANLALMALLWAMQHSGYWAALHYTFGLARAHDHGNRQIAGLDAIVILATTVAPAVGGIMATAFGIAWVYGLSCVIFLVAIIPMLRKNQGPATVELKISLQQIKTIRRDLYANLCAGGVQATEAVIWPLFVFFIVSSYAGVGILSSVIAIASMAVTLYVGRRSEKVGAKPYIKQGMATYSVTALARTLVQNTGHVFGLNLLAGVGRSLWHTPYLSRYYANSDGPRRLGYITAMETSHSLGAGIFLSFLLIMSAFASDKSVLVIGLATAAATILGIRLIR